MTSTPQRSINLQAPLNMVCVGYDKIPQVKSRGELIVNLIKCSYKSRTDGDEIGSVLRLECCWRCCGCTIFICHIGFEPAIPSQRRWRCQLRFDLYRSVAYVTDRCAFILMHPIFLSLLWIAFLLKSALSNEQQEVVDEISCFLPSDRLLFHFKYEYHDGCFAGK